MATYKWFRQGFNGTSWLSTQQQWLITQLPAGQTITRTRFAWGFAGTTSTSVVAPRIATTPMVLGIVTTVGNGTEVPPDPIGASTDQAPPTQRWLWIEQRAPTVVAWDGAAATAIWQSSPPQEEVDAHGQVLAPGNMGTGNTLNLWATYRSSQAWDASGSANMWAYFNVLIRTG